MLHSGCCAKHIHQALKCRVSTLLAAASNTKIVCGYKHDHCSKMAEILLLLWKKIGQSCCIPMNHHHSSCNNVCTVWQNDGLAFASCQDTVFTCNACHCPELPRIAQDCLGLPRIGFLIQKQVFSHSCMIAMQYGVTIINVYVADWTKSSAIKHFPLEPNIPHLFTLSRHLSLVEPSCKKSPRQEKTKQQNACLYHFPSYIRAISTFNLKWIDRNGKYLLYCKIHEIQHLITNDAVVVGELFGLFAKNHVMFNWIEAGAPVVLLDN